MDKKNLDDFASVIEENANEVLEDTLLDDDANEVSRQDIDYSDIVKNSAKANMSKVPWLTAIFLIIIVALAFGFMFFKNNPQTIFTMTTDNFFNSISSNFSENSYDVSKGKVISKFNIKSNDDNSMLYEELSKLNFDIDFAIDNANELSYMNISSKYLNDDFVDMEIYSDKSNVYVYSKDLFDSFIKLDKTNSYKITGSKDIKNILSGINVSIDKVATSEKINGSKEDLDLSNKTYKVYKTSLLIDKTNSDRVAETFINSLKSDDEFVASLAKVKNSNSDNVRAALQRFLPKLKQFFKDNNKLEVILYTDRRTNDFIKGEIVGDLGSLSVIKNDNSFDFSLKNVKDNTSTKGSVSLITNDKKTDYTFNINFETKQNKTVIYMCDGKVAIKNYKSSSFGKSKPSNAIAESDLTDGQRFGIFAKVLTNSKLSKLVSFIK